MKIIVTADDYGMHADVNAGIRDCVERGLVDAVSVGVCGESCSDEQIGLLRSISARRPVSLGLHLMLTDGHALTGVSSITDSSGKFPSYILDFVKKYVAGKIRLADIESELEKQIYCLADKGIAISHVDSHQHVHLLPGIWPIVRRLAERHRIKRIRSGYQSVISAICTGSILRTVFQGIARARWASLPFRMRTLGVLCSGNFSVERIRRPLLRELKAGREVEIMTHPGLETPAARTRFAGFDAHWEREMKELESLKLFVNRLPQST